MKHKPTIVEEIQQPIMDAEFVLKLLSTRMRTKNLDRICCRKWNISYCEKCEVLKKGNTVHARMPLSLCDKRYTHWVQL